MARAAFLLLVFVNLVFFVWARGYLGGTGEDAGREPARLTQQLQADRLQVTVKDEASAQPPEESSPVADGAAVARACRRVGPMPSADAEKLAKALTDKGGTATANAVEETSYWVFIPPEGGKDGSDKRAQALKKQGVTDFFIVNDEGVNRGAISLGLFHQESAAKDLIQRLSKLGVKSAKIGTKVRKTEKVLLDLHGSIDLLDGVLSGRAVKVADCPAE